MLRRGLKIALGLALVAALSCAGLVALVLAILEPEPPDPAIVHARPPAVRRVAVVASGSACPVSVRVTGAEPGDVTLMVVVLSDGDPGTDARGLDADGRASLSSLACGELMLRAEARGYVSDAMWLHTEPGVATDPVELVLTRGRRIHGRITDPDGEPVPDATVDASGAETASEDDGSYEVWVSDRSTAVNARAFGYQYASARLPEAEGDARVDLTLEPFHEVRVWCSGLENDDCGEMPLQCTTPLSLVGGSCHRRDTLGETRCSCPDGAAAVRGGGRAVSVAADATDAWLDFRDTAVLTGRVLFDGAPASWCEVAAIRIPDALEDLPRGLVAGRETNCGSDGRFTVDGLIAGDWELVVRARLDHAPSPTRTLVPRHLGPRERVDLGDIEVTGGGGIEGILVDGLTGEPLHDEPILALREGAPGERTTPMGTDAEADGTFRFEGLPAGRWTLAHPLSPQERVYVTVRDGEVTRGVEIVTSDATALDVNGFSLEDAEGDLVVTEVEPDSPAEEAGLASGDAVVGLKVAGFALPRSLGSRGQALTRAVLAHWDGPGVSLVVERDGEEQDVPLDW